MENTWKRLGNILAVKWTKPSEIRHPFHSENILYALICAAGILLLVLSVDNHWVLQEEFKSVVGNIGAGVVSSACTAWLLEVRSTKSKNKQAVHYYEQTYEAVFQRIKGLKNVYAFVLAQRLSNSNSKTDFNKRQTWQEWYSSLKSYFDKSNDAEKNNIIYFLNKCLTTQKDGLLKEVNYLIDHIPDYQNQNIINDNIYDAVDKRSTLLKS